jgi:ketosteroid isomerase-like protein
MIDEEKPIDRDEALCLSSLAVTLGPARRSVRCSGVMTEENVEIVRRAVVAVLQKPRPDFDTVNQLYDPDHELISLQETIEGGTRRGAPGFRDWLHEVDETWDYLEVALDEVRALDESRVLAVTPQRVRAKRSGIELEDRRRCSVMTLRGGKIVRTEMYSSVEDALEAAGLSDKPS